MSHKRAAHAARKHKQDYQKYNKLRDGSVFRFPDNPTEYIKIGNAFALNNETGKEIIPSLFDRVEWLGWQDGYYPLHNA